MAELTQLPLSDQNNTTGVVSFQRLEPLLAARAFHSGHLGVVYQMTLLPLACKSGPRLQRDGGESEEPCGVYASSPVDTSLYNLQMSVQRPSCNRRAELQDYIRQRKMCHLMGLVSAEQTRLEGNPPELAGFVPLPSPCRMTADTKAVIWQWPLHFQRGYSWHPTVCHLQLYLPRKTWLSPNRAGRRTLLRSYARERFVLVI